jgi:hypothetical protein
MSCREHAEAELVAVQVSASAQARQLQAYRDESRAVLSCCDGWLESSLDKAEPPFSMHLLLESNGANYHGSLFPG